MGSPSVTRLMNMFQSAHGCAQAGSSDLGRPCRSRRSHRLNCWWPCGLAPSMQCGLTVCGGRAGAGWQGGCEGQRTGELSLWYLAQPASLSAEPWLPLAHCPRLGLRSPRGGLPVVRASAAVLSPACVVALYAPLLASVLLRMLFPFLEGACLPPWMLLCVLKASPHNCPQPRQVTWGVGHFFPAPYVAVALAPEGLQLSLSSRETDPGFPSYLPPSPRCPGLGRDRALQRPVSSPVV